MLTKPKEFASSVIAKQFARPAIADALIAHASKTPHKHIPGYMERFWVFNPFEDENAHELPRGRLAQELPSARVHHILRADNDPFPHDHPWDARTFVFKGWYIEERLVGGQLIRYTRMAGDTATLKFMEFHRIVEVSPGGVWTLFVMGKQQGDWGMLVNGIKIPWKLYQAGVRELPQDQSIVGA